MLERDGGPREWETLLRLAGVVVRAGAGRRRRRARRLRDRHADRHASWPTRSRASPAATAAELLDELEPRRGPERMLDLMLRTGPYGDGFGADPDGLTLDVLERNPHGIDLGPLAAAHPEVLRTPSGKIELAPEPIVADVPRLRGLARAPPERRDRADRPPPAALEQLLDAQPRPRS